MESFQKVGSDPNVDIIVTLNYALMPRTIAAIMLWQEKYLSVS